MNLSSIHFTTAIRITASKRIYDFFARPDPGTASSDGAEYGWTIAESQPGRVILNRAAKAPYDAISIVVQGVPYVATALGDAPAVIAVPVVPPLAVTPSAWPTAMREASSAEEFRAARREHFPAEARAIDADTAVYDTAQVDHEATYWNGPSTPQRVATPSYSPVAARHGAQGEPATGAAYPHETPMQQRLPDAGGRDVTPTATTSPPAEAPKPATTQQQKPAWQQQGKRKQR